MKAQGSWHFEGRLAIRQALIAALVGLLLGVVFSAHQVSREFRESEAEERQEIEQLLAVLREPAAQAAYQLSVAAAAVVVQGTLSFGPVQEAELKNDFGETLARGRGTAPPVDPGVWWARFVAPTHEHRLSLSHGPGGKRVGELRLVTTRGPRVERLMQGIWREGGLSVLRSLIVAMALGVCFHLTLTRPLSAVARRIRNGPAQDEPAAPAEAPRADEIGEISAAFERYEREARERRLSMEAAASALAASEMRHRRIVETAGEGVWQIDEHGTTTLANEAMAEMLGTRAALLLGRSMFDFMDEEGARVAKALFLTRQSGGHERGEFRFLRADGRELWTYLSTCPITDADGRHAGALAMVTNATERRRRDEELRASNAQLREMVGDLEAHKLDMAHIAELNELLQSARAEAEAYGAIGAVGARLFAGGSGGLAMVMSGTEMATVCTWGPSDWLPLRYERDDCWAIRRGGPHLQAPGHGVPCNHVLDGRIDLVLCMPLYVEGELLGVLHLADGDAADHELLDGALRRRVEIFAQVIKLGLSNLRLRESLRDQALRDVLTGLPNRRLFDETLPRELARCARSGQALTVAVVDVDRFKHFNDSYGHDVGDRVLRAVAAALLRNIRSGDMACRWGGDEFMCLLIGATAAEARARFVELLVRTGEGDELGAGAMPEAVTFTVGLASAPDAATDAAGLLRAADAALYVAKARGGHCVEVAPGRAAAASLATGVLPA
ncbi:PAS domain S-box-containing protein/diguanylate cyclase (GGDEF)-like protein [Rubrivivax sp. A210]|uniref:diguanylate cyclase n=1 Tax=Rubrivivax sp. A210 TaxID=2772301 RepID=UPI00191B317C|nr:diguanylate cyclase [Rubrivivax sp. A210]CAD5370571.1 PAS domain S-box-containing protein/diguanylate cyclase (GGDEF)-like protein [Rubrivivax sp. A210]